LRKIYQPGLWIALLCAGSMWFYVQRVLIPYQKAEAVTHERPRGNLSDLYPRWLGARELLQRGRNPYSDGLTVEIQKGYYGRELDAARPNDPKDQQGFAYPVYVVFLLAPLIGFPFHGVQIFFYCLLAGLTAASVWLWLKAIQWRLRPLAIVSVTALMVGSFPVVQGIKLQQLSLLVAALLAGATACVASGSLFCGGMLLAFATVKPQLAGPFVAWLLPWAVSDWKARWRVVFGFGTMMALLLGGAEIILPGWWRMFAGAVGKYHRYTENQSVLDELVPWAYAGKILAAAAVLACAFFLWKLRNEPANSAAFGVAAALVAALTVMIVPMYAPYNQVLVLPAVLVLVRDRELFLPRRGMRVLFFVATLAMAWQWMACLGLSAAYFVSRDWALAAWQWPFMATFAFPVLTFLLILLEVQARDAGRFRNREAEIATKTLPAGA
jgi:hypothetical protein